MKPKPLGFAMALVGNLLFGWGLYNLMAIGSCGGHYAPCPADSWPFFLAVPVGILLSVIAIFAGGGPLAFLSIFTTVGVTSLLQGFNGGVPGEGGDVFSFVFGGIFMLPLVFSLWLVVAGRRKLRKAERLVTDGKRGVATVTDVHDTGVTVNGNPRVKLTLRIEPEDGGPAFQRHKTIVASRIDIPRPGRTYPAWYYPDDPKATGLGTDLEPGAPPDIRTLFQKAARAQAAPPPAPVPEVQGTITHVPARQDWVSELGRLNDLRLQGALTDEEFSRAKEKLLAGSPPASTGG